MWPCMPLTASLPDMRAAAAVLDHVAQHVGRGRLADQAVVELFAARLEHVADHHGAVGGRAFLVAGDQEGDRALVVGVRGGEFLARDHHGRDRGLHVGRAAAVQLAVAHAWASNGSEVHCVSGPVGTTSVWPANTTSGCASPRRAHRLVTSPDCDGFAEEAERRQQFGQAALAALVVGRDGGQGDQFFGQGLGPAGGAGWCRCHGMAGITGMNGGALRCAILNHGSAAAGFRPPPAHRTAAHTAAPSNRRGSAAGRQHRPLDDRRRGHHQRDGAVGVDHRVALRLGQRAPGRAAAVDQRLPGRLASQDDASSRLTPAFLKSWKR